jgi:membrane protein
VAPGALAAAVAWQLLQTFGGLYIERVVATATAVNAVFALVLGLMAFLYLAAYVLVLCVEIDVVRVNHLYPRSLLALFTDDARLTRGDERVYTDAAIAQKAKGFQAVDVRFEDNVARDGGPAGETPSDGSRARSDDRSVR